MIAFLFHYPYECNHIPLKQLFDFQFQKHVLLSSFRSSFFRVFDISEWRSSDIVVLRIRFIYELTENSSKEQINCFLNTLPVWIDSDISIRPRNDERASVRPIYSRVRPRFNCDETPLIRIAAHSSVMLWKCSVATLLKPCSFRV